MKYEEKIVVIFLDSKILFVMRQNAKMCMQY